MKLKFKKQTYQTEAVEAVIDCFAGQSNINTINYQIDPGLAKQTEELEFKNQDIELSASQLLTNIRQVQSYQNLPLSSSLQSDKKTGFVNLDIEMETGTGKTYCYIKTMFELHRRFGWRKFIVVVPSIAIREGVAKSIEITADHFLEEYGKRVRFFIYNSKQLHNLESFSSDAGINVMVINVQAFNVTGKDARRIYEEQDSFQSRRPIDVIKSNRPILILDEPQRLEGSKTIESFKEFNPLMILRYSATHKTEYNKIYRLDALDAYQQKLVKKIAVRGISMKGLSGTNAYLYLESIEIFSHKPPQARIEMEIKQKNGSPKRVLRKLSKNANLHQLSGLEEYNGFVIADINAHTDIVNFTNGQMLQVGDVIGEINESALRRIQIREALSAHFEKEQMLFHQGIKVLSLFFIDSVAKYRGYDEQGEVAGEYAQVFEEEYRIFLNEIIDNADPAYKQYLMQIEASKTHNGYFSIDKKSKHLIDPVLKKKSNEADDVDAYDLILRDKERLLSLEEPVRFIFSHSALREGWDNPNVFVICTLKQSDNTVTRRQEVGRGMRLAVNQYGERMDNPATVHDINVLTVVASESYKNFVSALQQDISTSLSMRPKIADAAYFQNKAVSTDVTITKQMANQIYTYLIDNHYIDAKDYITPVYLNARSTNSIADFPSSLSDYSEQILMLVDHVFSEDKLPQFEDDRRTKINPLNANFDKKEFKELWRRINKKAIYTVEFNSDELTNKCIQALNDELQVTPMQFIIQRGEQTTSPTFEELKNGETFTIQETSTINGPESAHSLVKYDLVGQLTEETQQTRETIVKILQGISPAVFKQYIANPEDFIAKSAKIINEQKATVIVEHLAYNALSETYDLEIFTQEKTKQDFSQKGDLVKNHIYDYVFTDSANERNFVKDLDSSTEVVVYAKLPKGFFIPTPVGNYNPDWAISFKAGSVKHIYFIAETKGSMSSMELRKVEASKIECARKFFGNITSDQVKYDVLDSYSKLMELVQK